MIVPVYNVERYLRQCLESLRVQTLRDIEIVCVDDGSTDGSLAILREYEACDARFKVISKPNAGYGHSMNCGIAAAQAPYIGILESDDFCSADMCENLYRTAVEHDVDIVRSDITLYWSTPVERTELAHFVVEDDCGEVFEPRKEKHCFGLPPALYSMLARKRIIEANGLRLLETPGASYQDTSFSFKLWACASRAIMIPDSFVFYRQDNEQSSINQKDKLYFVSDEYKELERFIERDCERFGVLFPLLMKRKYSAYKWNYERIATEYHLEFAYVASEQFRAAKQQGYLCAELFSSDEWSDLHLLIANPTLFVERMDEWSSGRAKRFHVGERIKRKMGRR